MPGFDSILVRLKAALLSAVDAAAACFDSILVRLKVPTDIAEFVSPFLFRFHTGSIKSDFQLLENNAKNGFDSILVRLKVPDTEVASREIEQFRFHTGSIKSLRN